METVVRKFSSFEEADAADREDYRAMTPEQRAAIFFSLKELFGEDAFAEGSAGIHRVPEPERS
jgi:hypothetical protein